MQFRPVEGRESFWQSRQEYQTQTNKGIFSTVLPFPRGRSLPRVRPQVPKRKVFLVLSLENPVGPSDTIVQGRWEGVPAQAVLFHCWITPLALEAWWQ